jgi:hypothetical protein
MCAMAERRHSQEQRELAEQRLRQGHAAAAVARDLKLPERSVARWRDALGITPKPRGFPRGKARRVTALSVEPDFADWVAKLGKHFADLQTLAEANHLSAAQRQWREYLPSPDIARLLGRTRWLSGLFVVNEKAAEADAATAVGGAIESQAASALFARAGGEDWDAVGAESLRERALPSGQRAARAEGKRLRGEVLTRLVALRDSQPTGSPLDAACVIVASHLLGEDLGRQELWATQGWVGSVDSWQARRLSDVRKGRRR